jgi:hypothetical protein
MHNPKHIHSRDFWYKQGIQNYYIIFIGPRNLYDIIIIGYYNQNVIDMFILKNQPHDVFIFVKTPFIGRTNDNFVK